MRKFKHKDGYFKALGQHEIAGMYHVSIDKGLPYLVPAELIENSADWIEQVERDYEILAYDISGIKDIIDKPIIKSVKRLSDGGVFSVGNLHQSPFVNTCKIDKIYEKDGVIWLDHVSGATRLDQAVKVETRKSILTSEDGPELFEDDKAFCINKDSKKCKIWPITIQDYDPASHFIYFSTREAAEDYRLNNARVLSLEDMRSYVDGFKFVKCKQLVKSRL